MSPEPTYSHFITIIYVHCSEAISGIKQEVFYISAVFTRNGQELCIETGACRRKPKDVALKWVIHTLHLLLQFSHLYHQSLPSGTVPPPHSCYGLFGFYFDLRWSYTDILQVLAVKHNAVNVLLKSILWDNKWSHCGSFLWYHGCQSIKSQLLEHFNATEEHVLNIPHGTMTKQNNLRVQIVRSQGPMRVCITTFREQINCTKLMSVAMRGRNLEFEGRND